MVWRDRRTLTAKTVPHVGSLGTDAAGPFVRTGLAKRFRGSSLPATTRSRGSRRLYNEGRLASFLLLLPRCWRWLNAERH